MLVLTRRPGERVMIGEDVIVTVVEVRGDTVRLGFEAPAAVRVHREEIYREPDATETDSPPERRGGGA